LRDMPAAIAASFSGGGGLLDALKNMGLRIADTILMPLMDGLKKATQAAVSVGSSIASAFGGSVAGGAGAQVAGIASSLGGVALAASGAGKAMAAAGIAGSIGMAAATAGIGLAAVGVVALIKHLGSGRDAVKKFADSFGGFGELHRQLAVLGDEGERLWRNLTQGVGANNPKQAKAAIDAITSALEKSRIQTAQFNTDLQRLLSRVQDLGGGLDEGLRPYLQQLQDAGRLTQENIDLLAVLSGHGEVDWKKLEEAAGRYGIATDKLGQGFNSAKLHNDWQQIIDDIDLFERGGVDVSLVLADMADDISDLVNRSVKFGVEIPENMRPWIQQLAASGQLLDENGQKITDISKLTFGETLETSLQKLTKEIRALIKTLGGVPAAIDDIPKQINIDVVIGQKGDFNLPPISTNPADWVFPEPPVHHMAEGASTGAFVARGRLLHFNAGGIVPRLGSPLHLGAGGDLIQFSPRGSDVVPAMLTPGEGIVSPPGMSRLGADGLSALNRGEPLGGGDTYHITQELHFHGHDAQSIQRLFSNPDFRSQFEREVVLNPHGMGTAVRRAARMSGRG
jgi:hypothetical protein